MRLGVGRRGGGDDDGLGGVHGGLDGRRGRGAHLGRDVGGTGRVGIGDDDAVDAGRGRQQPAVETPDPPRSEQCDLHRPSSFASRASPPSRRSAAARTRRPIAALSDGGPQQLSCSTISQPS